MAQYQLKAGAHIDLLTADELNGALGSVAGWIMGYLEAGRHTVVRNTAETVTDPAGLLGANGLAGPGVEIYSCPTGFEARVERIALTAPGYSAAAPLDTGSIYLYRNAPAWLNIEYFWPYLPGRIAPDVSYREGEHSSIHLTSGERLVVAGEALPAGLPVYFAVQVCLYRRQPPPLTAAAVRHPANGLARL